MYVTDAPTTTRWRLSWRFHWHYRWSWRWHYRSHYAMTQTTKIPTA